MTSRQRSSGDRRRTPEHAGLGPTEAPLLRAELEKVDHSVHDTYYGHIIKFPSKAAAEALAATIQRQPYEAELADNVTRLHDRSAYGPVNDPTLAELARQAVDGQYRTHGRDDAQETA